jgi:hypothetical protein
MGLAHAADLVPSLQLGKAASDVRELLLSATANRAQQKRNVWIILVRVWVDQRVRESLPSGLLR